MAKWNGGISLIGAGRVRLGLTLSSMFHDHRTILLYPSRRIREERARAQTDPIGHQLALITVPQEIYD